MYELKTIEIAAADLRTGDRVVNGAGRFSLTVRRVELIDGIVNVWIEGRNDPGMRPWYEFTEAQKITVQRPTAPPADEMFDAIDRTDAAAAQFERDPQNRGSIEGRRCLLHDEPSPTCGRCIQTHYSDGTPRPQAAVTAQSFADELIALVHRYEQLAAETKQYLSAALAEPRDELPADDARQLDAQLDTEIAAVSTGAEVVRIPSRVELTGPGMPAPETREVGPIEVTQLGNGLHTSYEIGQWSTEDGAFVHAVTLSHEEAQALYYALGRELFG
jgi:hypothetical protein